MIADNLSHAPIFQAEEDEPDTLYGYSVSAIETDE